MKRLLVILLCAALVIAVICAAMSGSRVAAVKQNCALTAYAALSELSRALEEIEASGEYTAAQNEAIQIALAELAGAVSAAESFYPHSISWQGVLFTPLDIAAALGCRVYGQQNDAWIESVLYDSMLSADELTFIQRLRADVEPMLAALSDEDGYGLRDGLSWDDVRALLDDFFDVWGWWSTDPDSPYVLLIVDD